MRMGRLPSNRIQRPESALREAYRAQQNLHRSPDFLANEFKKPIGWTRCERRANSVRASYRAYATAFLDDGCPTRRNRPVT